MNKRLKEVWRKLDGNISTLPASICTLGSERSFREDGISSTITARVDDGNHLIIVEAWIE